jgi:hypothetical protein
MSREHGNERQEPLDTPLQHQHRCLRQRLENFSRVADGDAVARPRHAAAAEHDFARVLRWLAVSGECFAFLFRRIDG